MKATTGRRPALALLLAITLALALLPATVGAAILPPGSVTVAPGVAEVLDGPWQIAIVRTADSRLYWASSVGTGEDNLPPHWPVQGWQEIPGGGRSLHAPAVARYGDRMYVAIVGHDLRLYLQSMDRFWNWTPGWQEVPGNGRFSGAPALVEYFGTLWVFAPGLDFQLYHQVYWPGWNAAWAPVPGGLRVAGVAVIEFESALHLVALGIDTQRIYHQLAGWGWGGWREIPGGGKSYHPPALSKSYFQGPYLYVLVRGTGDGLYYQVADRNVAWHAGWRGLPGGATTPYGPGLSTRQGHLRAYAVGHDKRFYYVNLYKSNTGTDLRINWDTPGWTLVPRN